MEYVKIVDGKPKKLTAEEVQTILDAEKGTFRWREEKPRTGNEGLDKLKAALDGKSWERTDHAGAKFRFEVVLTLETRDAEAFEKKFAKQPAKGAATPAVKKPNF